MSLKKSETQLQQLCGDLKSFTQNTHELLLSSSSLKQKAADKFCTKIRRKNPIKKGQHKKLHCKGLCLLKTTTTAALRCQKQVSRKIPMSCLSCNSLKQNTADKLGQSNFAKILREEDNPNENRQEKNCTKKLLTAT